MKYTQSKRVFCLVSPKSKTFYNFLCALCMNTTIFSINSILYSTLYPLLYILSDTILRATYAQPMRKLRSSSTLQERSFMHNQPTLSHLARTPVQYNQPIEIGCGFQAQTEQSEVPSHIYSHTQPSVSTVHACILYISYIICKRAAHKEHTYHYHGNY